MSDGTVEPTLSTMLRPPVVDGSPVEVADGVYVIPDGRTPLVPNVGIIVGTRAVLVVDTGLGPRSGAAVHRIAKSLAGDRPLLLTITHFHPEHGFGAQAFGDAVIVYNRTQYEEFRQKAEGFLGMFRALGGWTAEELEGVQLVDPHIVYDNRIDLDLGGKQVQLQTWGTAHTRGDQTVFLPAERVLFTGDLVENRFYPIYPFFPPHDIDVDGHRWITVMQELERLAPNTVVPGHGEVGDATLLTTTREYMTTLSSETKRLAAEGRQPDEIISILSAQLKDRYPDWDTSEAWRIATGVLTFLAQ